jgi:hypothetical protein
MGCVAASHVPEAVGLHPILNGRIVVLEAPLQFQTRIVSLLSYSGALKEGAQVLRSREVGRLTGVGFRFGPCHLQLA